jgi:hypothetical protein
MKFAQLVRRALVVVSAMGLVFVSAASATEPLFTPVGASVLGDSGLAVLIGFSGADIVDCVESHSFGNIQNTLLIGNVVVHYLGCTSSGPGGSGCPVHSPGAAEGLILTATLHGILGLILPSKETGILFLPVVGKTYVELEENTCTVASAISGTIAGLVEPVGTGLTTKGNVLFEREAGPGNNQAILDIDLTHGLGLVVPKLTSFTASSALTQLQLVTFSVATEVT